MKFKNLVILMSTYNGEHFIQEQLDSIIRQDYKTWNLLIRDDGSEDATRSIIQKYEKMDPRISIFKDADGNVGPKKSFLKMLTEVDAPIYMFADQDDIWHSDKVRQTVSWYQKHVKEPSEPTLVYTNMSTVDQNGNLLQKNVLPSDLRVSFVSSLVMNVVTGCTVLVNQSLANKVKLSDSDSIVMHDWWMALIARFYGNIFYLPVTTIDYRQHSNNAVGVGHSLKSRLNKVMNFGKLKEAFALQMKQSNLLVTRINRTQLSDESNDLEEFIALEESGTFVSKFMWLIRHHVKKGTIVGTLSFYFLFLTSDNRLKKNRARQGD